MPKSQRYYSLLIFVIIKLSNCEKKSVMESFIVGGEYAKIHSFPHSAYLQAETLTGTWMCGCSILNQQILLTAAHCLFQSGVNAKIVVYAGHENLGMVKIIRDVTRYITHNRYNAISMNNDIALAMMDRDIPFGTHIKRVILKSPFPKGFTMAYVAGWGVVNETTKQPSVRLKSVRQEIRSRKVCGLIGRIHNGMMCAGSINKRSDRPAQGDSGSALIAQLYYQIGLISFRVDKYPALLIYTNTTYYIPWIQSAASIICSSCKKTSDNNCISIK